MRPVRLGGTLPCRTVRPKGPPLASEAGNGMRTDRPCWLRALGHDSRAATIILEARSSRAFPSHHNFKMTGCCRRLIVLTHFRNYREGLRRSERREEMTVAAAAAAACERRRRTSSPEKTPTMTSGFWVYKTALPPGSRPISSHHHQHQHQHQQLPAPVILLT